MRRLSPSVFALRKPTVPHLREVGKVYQVFRRLGVVFTVTGLIAVSMLPAGAGGRITDAPAPAQGEHDYVMVKLNDPPTASYMGGISGLARTKPQPGRKLGLNSNAARAYGRHLADRRQNYRGWLQSSAPRAQIVREYSVVFNGFVIKLNGEARGLLAQGPGAAAVSPSFLVRPSMTVSNGLIDAVIVWTLIGSQANAGSGVKVGIIDTGIDDTHPAFDCKVVGPKRVYASGIALPPGAAQPIVFDHGTHVAGTVAGCVLSPPYPPHPVTGNWSGVAPGAGLADYNVFPGFGAGFRAFGGSAFSHDIAAALEDAVTDGMDVLNMSLGGGVQGPHDFLAEAVDATADAGVVVAVAAGNSGPGDSTVTSPGNAAGALTAGASTNPHFVGIPVTVGSSTPGAALGDFNNYGMVTADYTVTSPANGCTTISTILAGKIALIDRGICTFTTKIRNAQSAGAIGVLVVNNVAGDPVAMAHDGTAFPTIPAAMLGFAEGNAIKPSGTATVDGTAPQEFITANADIIAGFSSRGPTPFTFLIKPDVTAPGVNVFSSVFDGEFAFFQGTSMATPHVAGAAALLLDLHPGWSPADVKSALVNTAKRPVWRHTDGTTPTGVLDRGGGRIDLDAANATPLTIDSASASFGRFIGNQLASGTRKLAVRNVSGSTQECSVSVSGPAIVTASLSAFTLAPGGSTTLTLTLNGGRANQTASGDRSGDVEIACDSTTLRVPWWTRIDREGKP